MSKSQNLFSYFNEKSRNDKSLKIQKGTVVQYQVGWKLTYSIR